jgi:hypothetical protein
MLLGDACATREVDRLLNGALRKVRRAEKQYRASRRDG